MPAIFDMAVRMIETGGIPEKADLIVAKKVIATSGVIAIKEIGDADLQK